MAEQTLLQIVQTILSSMSSDEVNSIGDNSESIQVANIVQNKFFDIVARGALSVEDQLFQLNPSDDPTKPVLMYVPSGIAKIEWIKYFDKSTQDSQQVDQFGAFSHDLNTDLVATATWHTTSATTNSISIGTKTFTVASGLPVVIGQNVTAASGSNSMTGPTISYSGQTLTINVQSVIGAGTFSSWTISNVGSPGAVAGYKYVTMLPVDQFIDFVCRFNPTDNDVFSFPFHQNGVNFTFYYKNDHQPSYCTVISNEFIIFDSYNNNFDSTLQASNTMCLGQIVPAFQMTDSFVPPLNDQQFPLLLNESKALAFYELKQMPHAKAEQEIKRQWAVAQKTKSVSNRPSYFDELANYGRVPRTGGYSSGGYGAYKWMRGGGGSP